MFVDGLPCIRRAPWYALGTQLQNMCAEYQTPCSGCRPGPEAHLSLAGQRRQLTASFPGSGQRGQRALPAAEEAVHQPPQHEHDWRAGPSGEACRSPSSSLLVLGGLLGSCSMCRVHSWVCSRFPGDPGGVPRATHRCVRCQLCPEPHPMLTAPAPPIAAIPHHARAPGWHLRRCTVMLCFDWRHGWRLAERGSQPPAALAG